MTVKAKAVLKEAMSLSDKERAVLADELWRSIPHDPSDLELTPAQAKDLKRRLAEDRAGLSDRRDWEDVRQSLLRRK